MIRIIVAFQNSRTARQIREVVEGSGRTACVPCPTVAAVRRTLLAQHITGVVSGVKFPDGTVADLALDLPRGCGLLVLALPEQLALCPEEGILRLAAPVSRRELLASVRMLTALGEGSPVPVGAPPRHSEEERRIIREAKELLMARHGMAEETAHRFLQKQSMDLGMKMAQTAALVLGQWAR